MRRTLTTSVLSVALAAAWLAAPAFGGYGVQPNGQSYTVTTDSAGDISSPSALGIIVYLDNLDTNAYVWVSDSPSIGAHGLPAGNAVASCGPYEFAPWVEANKYSCQVRTILMQPGHTYYWWLTDSRKGDGSYFGRSELSGPFSFTLLDAPAAPVAPVTPAIPAVPDARLAPTTSAAISVVDAVNFPVMGGPSPDDRKDAFYTKVARKISRGRTNAVYCWGQGDWATVESAGAGYVELGFVDLILQPRSVHLSPTVCARLDLLHYSASRPAPGLWLAVAVDALAHEAIHTFGINNEAVTECYAMQLTAYTATQLGTTWSYGQALAQSLWSHYSLKYKPPKYLSPNCKNGGSLDLHPKSNTWP